MNSTPLRRCCHWYPNLSVERLCDLSSRSAVAVACRAETAESSDGNGKPDTSSYFTNWKATALGFLMGCWIPLTAFFVAAPDKSGANSLPVRGLARTLLHSFSSSVNPSLKFSSPKWAISRQSIGVTISWQVTSRNPWQRVRT